MTKVIAVAHREIVEKRRLILASFALGCLALVMPLLPVTGGFRANYSESRDIVAAFLGFALLNAAAIGSGLNNIARDMTERRMSFYFARPLSGIDIWGGKMLGGLLFAVFCAVAVILPATICGGGLFALQRINPQYFSTTSPGTALAASLALAVIALILTHSLSIALRSRSRWLILDFVAWTITGILVVALRVKLDSRGPSSLGLEFEKSYLVLFLIAALIAGAVQVVRGRTDLIRGHKFMSITLWSILGSALVAASVLVLWLDSTKPRDFAHVQVAAASAGGEWIYVEGSRRFFDGYPLTFLLNTIDGRAIRVDSRRWSAPPDVSGDGSHALWFETRSSIGSRNRNVAMWASLHDAVPRGVETEIAFDQMPAFALSPDGMRLATIDDNWTLVIHDLATHTRLTAVHVPTSGPLFSWRLRLSFLDRDRVRVYVQTGGDTIQQGIGPLLIGEVDLRSPGFRTTGGHARVSTFSANRADDRIFFSEGQDAAVGLADARTGTEIVRFERKGRGGMVFLPGRRIAVCDVDAGHCLMKVFDMDGHELRTIPLRQGVVASIPWAISADEVLVETSSAPWLGERPHSLDVVNVSSGTIRALGVTQNLRPWSRTCEVPVARPVFNTEKGRVVALDPLTGESKDLLR